MSVVSFLAIAAARCTNEESTRLLFCRYIGREVLTYVIVSESSIGKRRRSERQTELSQGIFTFLPFIVLLLSFGEVVLRG